MPGFIYEDFPDGEYGVIKMETVRRILAVLSFYPEAHAEVGPIEYRTMRVRSQSANKDRTGEKP